MIDLSFVVHFKFSDRLENKLLPHLSRNTYIYVCVCVCVCVFIGIKVIYHLKRPSSHCSALFKACTKSILSLSCVNLHTAEEAGDKNG